GISFAIVRRDLLQREGQPRADVLDLRSHLAKESMLNTPPTFNWYLLGLTVKWMLDEGGVAAFAERNARKSALLYAAIDGSGGFYRNEVDPAVRSRMNVPFMLHDAALDKAFLEEAKAARLIGLKGHRALGGMRASLYNAMPEAGVQALVDFMGDFARRHGSALQGWVAGKAQGPLTGSPAIPGDKSISHRAVMLAALADGTSRIEGFLEGADTRATAGIFEAMGVRIEAPAPGVRVVHGVGADGLRAPSAPLDCGNAGTGMRLLAGLLAGQRFDSTLVGDASLSIRPMRRVIEPLAAMGARIDSDDGHAPLRIRGGQSLHGIDY